MEKRAVTNTQRDTALTNATFPMTGAKLYTPVVTLSTEDNNEQLNFLNHFLEQLKSGFERTIKWNKYTSEMINQTKTNNFNHLIDPAFNKVNRLYVLSFENEKTENPFQSITQQTLK